MLTIPVDLYLAKRHFTPNHQLTQTNKLGEEADFVSDCISSRTMRPLNASKAMRDSDGQSVTTDITTASLAHVHCFGYL